ncbi:MAG: G1 family glutamic endopeptidase [Solirubrobacteraceae bacterium]
MAQLLAGSGARRAARIARLLTAALATSAVIGTAGAAAAPTLSAHGQLLHRGPQLTLNANSSSNWFGYNQGTLEQGGKLFNAISGDWTVPTATQHTVGQAESSSDWIGIGGGCVDAGCTTTDSTLIQTGTEQDVSATGAASYSAWYELVPAPSLTISSLTVSPGDHMHASLQEVASDANVWTITITDVTRNESYTTTVPYSSTHATAEWIEETPLEIGTNAGFAALPNLTNPGFNSGTTNGSPVKLSTAEQMDLTDSSGAVIGAPSAPNSALSGFNECAWASTCS